MARKHSKSAKKRTHRQRKQIHRQRAGGWGFTGSSSIPGTPGTVSNPMVHTGIGDCRATEPGYTIPTSQYGASMKGLPGMSGGKRTRRNRKGKTRKHRQRGGRYGFFPEGDVNPSGQAWWAGSYAPIQRIACEGTTQNPLNPTHTGSSAPPGAANPNYWMKQQGGGQLAPATYGVGNVDSMYHYSPTAGYANTASTWLDSVGAPVQLQVPFAARSMNQACLSTGGHPPLTGALQKGGGLLNQITGTVSALFGNGENENEMDMSGANVSIPPGAPVGIPNTVESNLNIAIRNNAANPFPAPESPASVGGKRKNRKGKGKKSRKGSRKHVRGGGEGNATGAGAPAQGQQQRPKILQLPGLPAPQLRITAEPAVPGQQRQRVPQILQVPGQPAPQLRFAVQQEQNAKRGGGRGKKSRKGSRKHMKGGVEGNTTGAGSGPAAAGAGPGASARRQPAGLPQPGQPLRILQVPGQPAPRLVIAGVDAAQVQPRQPQGPPLRVMGNPQLRFAVQQ